MSLYSKNYGGQNTEVSKCKLLTDKMHRNDLQRPLKMVGNFSHSTLRYESQPTNLNHTYIYNHTSIRSNKCNQSDWFLLTVNLVMLFALCASTCSKKGFETFRMSPYSGFLAVGDT